MQIHLDALGGIAGDMFAAALLDAFPEHEAGLCAAVRATVDVTCRRLRHGDGVLAGSRFEVREMRSASVDGVEHATHLHHERHDDARQDHAHDGHAHDHDHADHDHADHDHATHSDGGGSRRELGVAHRPWSAIKAGLCDSALDPRVRDHAIGIFTLLAEAEAAVHGIAVDDVAFHEVGAWDSIADVVAAAYFIATLDADRWRIGPLPLGSGRVSTAHGPLPVPAPATAVLLRGMPTIDDGIPGERVTPTGAAIARHLAGMHGGAAERVVRTVGRTGIGFGTKTLNGISNCLRVLVFDEDGPRTASSPNHRELAVIEFEVDDQSAEDLAMGLDRLRRHPDIFDVVQMPVFGKKGRMMTHVRALARPSAIADAAAACFRETTTIGLRHHVVSGAALPRVTTSVEVEGRAVRVKIVERPGGHTAKAEADDTLAGETHAARARLRRVAERLALRSDDGP